MHCGVTASSSGLTLKIMIVYIGVKSEKASELASQQDHLNYERMERKKMREKARDSVTRSAGSERMNEIRSKGRSWD